MEEWRWYWRTLKEEEELGFSGFVDLEIWRKKNTLMGFREVRKFGKHCLSASLSKRLRDSPKLLYKRKVSIVKAKHICFLFFLFSERNKLKENKLN